MSIIETPTEHLHGLYRDVLRAPDGRVLWDRGWQKNTIVVDARRLLAAFMRGAPVTALGIQGLQVGAGDDTWDLAGPPPTAPTDTALTDPNFFTLPRVDLQFDFLTGGVVTPTPTNRLQIIARLGPNQPPWPDANHPTGTLREFGLEAELAGVGTLFNYVRHPAIAKDPASTLERTIWLFF